jgi:hypothetical protein
LFNYMDIYDTYRVQANIDINIKRYRLWNGHFDLRDWLRVGVN